VFELKRIESAPDGFFDAAPPPARQRPLFKGRRLSLRLMSAVQLLWRRTTRIVVALGASSAIGALGNALSILGLALAAASGLRCRNSVLILVSGSTFACVRVVGSSRLTITANGLTTRILDTICLAQTCRKKHTYHHR
jgi:hypothetical protein